MPLFMDVPHKQVGGRYGVDHRRYWFDEASGKLGARPGRRWWRSRTGTVWCPRAEPRSQRTRGSTGGTTGGI
jgi:hypothetical protein